MYLCEGGCGNRLDYEGFCITCTRERKKARAKEEAENAWRKELEKPQKRRRWPF